MERYQASTYLDVIPDIAARYQGKYRVRGAATEVLEGDWRPQRLVVIEFPSMGQLLAFYHSEEYKPFRQLRQRSAHSRIIAIEGFTP
ncbi:MAG: DUF1330 domain-containing protein [Gammaproteobacteria bacterium]|nr:DUF1330 domain-containing protein [Gammaproteobacteria bacterium]MCP5417689.1 DUF1330 domain-containing protein [Chromatiaceae bacterium]